MAGNWRYIFILSLIVSLSTHAQQRVGVVLSGGGATGLAHVGVLKALEENEIPIDFITGTSAGALVGSLYAAGYSPEEIEAYVLSDEFQMMASGQVPREHKFLLRAEDPNASMIQLSFSKDSILKKSLPTNINSTEYLDFEMMTNLGKIGASRYNNFDSLFVPFRCVASDIARKESVTFSEGHLNAAVRASMTFPFFFRPIQIDGVLYFDGGLYNNFPADVLYETCSPDFIIGSNVSYNAELPDDADLIGQVTNMLTSYSNFELPCENGYLISPEPDVGTFNFEDVEKAINAGYQTTISQIDSLRLHIDRRVTKKELAEKRLAFRQKIVPLNVSKIVTSWDNKDLRYTRLALIRSKKNEILTEDQLEKRYYRLYETPQIDFIFPTIELKNDSTYLLNLDIKKSKEFKLDVGGHISSRPVNMGYIGLTYQTVGKLLTKSHIESYFGKFYGSANASFTVDFPAVYPVSSKVYFTMNRWDYFKSFATFFEEVKPSFLVQNEEYAGLEISMPLKNTMKSVLDGRWVSLTDEYYQTENFSNHDTADYTNFEGFSTSWSLVLNSLNRKQFASSGHFLKAKIWYVNGREHSVSGSTTNNSYDTLQKHSWINASLEFKTFLINDQNFHLGLSGQFVYNSHPLFANYTATLLSMNEFNLVPDAKTFFLPEYRAHQFMATGVNAIFNIRKNMDFRVDWYYYLPIIRVVQDQSGNQVFAEPFTGQSFLASTSLIYHSIAGPIRFTVNYLPEQKTPFNAQFSFGYVLFNERAVR